MPFAKKPQVFSAKINELTLGTGDKAVVLGGQNVFNLYAFDAPIANRPKIGIDVSDDPEQPCEGLTAFYAGCETLADRAKKAAGLCVHPLRSGGPQRGQQVHRGLRERRQGRGRGR